MAEPRRASIIAFEQLIIELTYHGAPKSLIQRARRSMADEVRHAEATGRLARRFGCEPNAARAVTKPVRSLLDLAIENDKERGMVRETYGALEASYQAFHAVDPGTRRVFAKIARDETRHAALAWDIHTWAVSVLGDSAIAKLEHARRAAIRELETLLDIAPHRDVRIQAGVPSPAHARHLMSGLAERVYSSRVAA